MHQEPQVFVWCAYIVTKGWDPNMSGHWFWAEVCIQTTMLGSRYKLLFVCNGAIAENLCNLKGLAQGTVRIDFWYLNFGSGSGGSTLRRMVLSLCTVGACAMRPPVLLLEHIMHWSH